MRWVRRIPSVACFRWTRSPFHPVNKPIFIIICDRGRLLIHTLYWTLYQLIPIKLCPSLLQIRTVLKKKSWSLITAQRSNNTTTEYNRKVKARRTLYMWIILYNSLEKRGGKKCATFAGYIGIFVTSRYTSLFLHLHWVSIFYPLFFVPLNRKISSPWRALKGALKTK